MAFPHVQVTTVFKAELAAKKKFNLWANRFTMAPRIWAWANVFLVFVTHSIKGKACGDPHQTH